MCSDDLDVRPVGAPRRGGPAAGRWACLLALLAGWGCARREAGEVVILTDLPPASCRELDSAFRDWARAADPAPTPVRLAWVHSRTRPDSEMLASARNAIDLVIGASLDWLPTRNGGDAPVGWSVFEAPDVGLLVHSGTLEGRALVLLEDGWEALRDRRLAGLIAWDDPRCDAPSRALMLAALDGPSWSEGYAGLVQTAALAGPVGLWPGAAGAKVDRGEAALAPSFAPGAGAGPGGPVSWRRLAQGQPGVVGVPGPVEPSAATQAFLRFLDETRRRLPLSPDHVLQARVTGLELDLLAALGTGAANATRGTEGPISAPPWPPESVTALRARDASGELLEALAGQLASGLASREWLLESWGEPPKPLDRDTLRRLATVADGRLAAEPRFRAWLRGEWTAWAARARTAGSPRRTADAERPTPAAAPVADGGDPTP